MENYRLLSPQTETEFCRYFEFRWRLLRAPWAQPHGSEQDEFDAGAYHVMACRAQQILGIGRIHSVNTAQAQIRYMAVDAEYRRRGIATAILAELENMAHNWQKTQIILNARQDILDFYLHHGYMVCAEGPLLFQQIAHKRMCKSLA